jgi:hypothetical protein
MKTLVLILVLACAAQSQIKPSAQPCSLTVDQSPSVREFKLGETYLPRPRTSLSESTDGLLGYTSDANADIGVIREDLSNVLKESQRFEGIREIETTYLDGKLASFEIRYDGSTRWESSRHFAAAIAEQLHLPTTGWVNSYHPRLNCDGFFVEASVPLYPILKIERTDLQSKIAARRAGVEQKKRADFKP